MKESRMMPPLRLQI